MPGKPQLKRPSYSEFADAVRETGSFSAACVKLGVNRNTALSWKTNDPDLARVVEQAMFEHRRLSLQDGAQRSQESAGAPDEISEVEILRARVSELQADQKRRRNESIAEARIVEDFRAALQKPSSKYSPLAIPKSHRASHQHEHVLLFSDAHAGEVVSLEQTLGLNEYDWDVMLARMARVQEAVKSFHDNRPYPINKLHVWSLGDGISGDIHEELAQTNDRTYAECVVDFSLDVSAWLEGFGDSYDEIRVTGVMGNHPRLTKKPQAKMAANNGDWIMHKFVETRLANHPKFSFNFPRARYTDVVVAERWRALLLHGDGVKSTMIDVPWGGIVRFLNKLRNQFAAAGRPLDIFALGHYHTANALEAGGPGVKTVMNGSLKGVDEYSLQRFGGGSPPRQLLLTVHPKRGITDISYLDAEDQIPAVEAARRAAS